MNKKLKIYLDTSVINFLFADDAPEKNEITVDFFENYLANFDVYISQIVLDVINLTSDPSKMNALLGIIDFYKLKIIDIGINDEVIRLAELYIKKCFTRKKLCRCSSYFTFGC